MARIPEEVIEQLKSGVDLVALVEANGVELERTGADRRGRCPFHDDTTPSLVVSPEKASGTASGPAKPAARRSTG